MSTLRGELGGGGKILSKENTIWGLCVSINSKMEKETPNILTFIMLS